jgi:hypothetical protein
MDCWHKTLIKIENGRGWLSLEGETLSATMDDIAKSFKKFIKVHKSLGSSKKPLVPYRREEASRAGGAPVGRAGIAVWSQS